MRARSLSAMNKPDPIYTFYSNFTFHCSKDREPLCDLTKQRRRKETHKRSYRKLDVNRSLPELFFKTVLKPGRMPETFGNRSERNCGDTIWKVGMRFLGTVGTVPGGCVMSALRIASLTARIPQPPIARGNT